MFYLTPAKHHLFLSSYSNLNSEMDAANKQRFFSGRFPYFSIAYSGAALKHPQDALLFNRFIRKFA
jgi:hypothetical protein